MNNSARLPVNSPCQEQNDFWHDDIFEQVEKLNARINNNPSDGSLYFQRARLYHEHEDFPEALADYQKALQLGFEEPDVFYFLARLYKETQQPREGLRYINHFIETGHAPVLGLIERARIYSEAGDYQQAIQDYEKAIGLRRPFTGDYFLELADLILKQDPYAFSAAIGVIDQGLGLLGWLPVLDDRAIELEYSRGNIEGALNRLDATMARLSRKEAYYVRKAGILSSVGRLEEGYDLYRKALQAIERLPAHQRNVPFMVELEQQARSAMAALGH